MMQSIQSREGHSVMAIADENGEGRQLKPKNLPCKFCSKRFRRVEHVQRHERTHTKEKPFACGWARCGKTFGRRQRRQHLVVNQKTRQSIYAYMDIRDLLVRHEKLVHLNEGSSKDGNRPRKPSSADSVQNAPLSAAENHVDTEMMGTSSSSREQPPQHYQSGSMSSMASSGTAPPDPRISNRTAACNLDLLSDAATQIASANEVNAIQSAIPQHSHSHSGSMPRIKSYEDSYGERSREPERAAIPTAYSAPPAPPAPAPPAPAFDDCNLFLDEFNSSSHFLPQSFEPDQPMGLWPKSYADGSRVSKPPSQYPSRLPSLAPDFRDGMENGGRLHDDLSRGPSLRITAADHNVIKSRLDEFSSVLPNDFVFPSRHTLARFLDGYFSGFHDHVPILHLPTISPAELAPELLLAVLAVGAQHRFENHRSNALWYAARAVVHEQIKRRRIHEMTGLLPTPAAYSPHSTRPSPSHGFRHSFSSVQQERPMTQDTHREPYSPNTPNARMETIQALLLLFVVGLWGAKAILHEALSLQSLLALLVRNEGLMMESTQTADWESWVRIEGANRTKLLTYCFFNLCSIAYNMPPLLMTSELNLFLPHGAKLWRAETAYQWQEARQSSPSMDISVQDAFSRLFSRSNQGPASYMSSLGNYVVIHAILQHIFLLKQTTFTAQTTFEVPLGIRPEDIEGCLQALRCWQMSFEQHQARAAESGQQSPNENSFYGGPVAYNSTALWRLASVRLYTDLSPSRTLETRDKTQVAQAFHDAPYLVRSVRLNRAVLQAIHALSMLVKEGVNYVARRKSSEWSVQHSLCNLECSILLSKWLMTLAAIGPTDQPPSMDERNLLEMLRRMLDETEFAVPIDPSISGGGPGHSGNNPDLAATEAAKLRQLASAVIRLWAETFKGSQTFDIVKVMGGALEGYADLLEKPTGRISSNSGLS